MKLSVELGTDPDAKRKLKEEKQKKRAMRKLAKRKKWVYFSDLVKISYWRSRYQRKYFNSKPSWDELKRELNTPQKAFAYFSLFVETLNIKHVSNEVDEPKDIVRKGVCTDKSMAYLYANLLNQYGFRTYIFWAGYKQDYMIPMCVVIGKHYTTTLGSTYKVHFGDQFDIMRDYVPDGTTWKVVDRTGSKLIMSYMFERSAYGSPDVIIYDDKYWGESSPLAYEIASKLRLVKKGNEPKPEV